MKRRRKSVGFLVLFSISAMTFFTKVLVNLSKDRKVNEESISSVGTVEDMFISKDFGSSSLLGDKENANQRTHEYCSNVFSHQNLPIQSVLRKYDVAVRGGNIPFRFGRGSCEFLVKLSESKLTAIAGDGKQYFQCTLNDLAETLRTVRMKLKFKSFPNITMCYNTGDSGVPNSREILASFCLSNSHLPPQLCQGSIVLPLHSNQKISEMSKVLEKGRAAIRQLPWRERKNRAIWRGSNNHVTIEQLNTLKSIKIGDDQSSGVLEWGNAMVQWRLGAQPTPRTRLVNISKEFGDHLDALIGEYEEKFVFSHKYIVALDGYGPFSGIFKRALAAASVTLRVGHYAGLGEWYEPFLEEFRHFIPIRYDMGDLKETIEWLRDPLQNTYAKTVSREAQEIMEKLLQPETMYCYIFEILSHFSKFQGDQDSFEAEIKKASALKLNVFEFDLMKKPRISSCRLLRGNRLANATNCVGLGRSEAHFIKSRNCSDSL